MAPARRASNRAVWGAFLGGAAQLQHAPWRPTRQDISLMSSNTSDRGIAMLVRVLEGTPYSVVAKEFGVGHSAVEKRVKAVERRLRHLVGVTGSDAEEPLNVHQMRALRQQYLNAIDALRNTPVVERKIRRQITEDDLARAAALTHRHSNCPTRDTALLYTVFATGAKPIEIARLTVRDYLTEDGVAIEEAILDQQTAFNGKPRRIFFCNRRAVHAIDAYLEERLRLGHGTRKSKQFRGLDPDSNLFLTNDGRGLQITGRVNGKTRHHHAVILDTYRRIFARAGLSSLQTFHLNGYCIAGRVEKTGQSSGACRTVSRTPAAGGRRGIAVAKP